MAMHSQNAVATKNEKQKARGKKGKKRVDWGGRNEIPLLHDNIITDKKCNPSPGQTTTQGLKIIEEKVLPLP